MCRDLIQGIDCIRPLAFARPALRSRPADGFPVYGKTIALIYMCAFPDQGNMFRHTPPQGYTRSALHRYCATRLQGYTPPPGRTGGEGRPWTPSGHALIFERGAVRASRKPSAFAGLLRNCAARLKIHA